MYNVYQHWDPLRVCVVGRSYPPEFYSWIEKSAVRSLFEKIAIETEEDYQKIIKKLESFGVEVLRPDLAKNKLINGKYIKPPMTPRDYTVMIGEKFYTNYECSRPFDVVYKDIKDPSWPSCNNLEEFKLLPQWIQNECVDLHKIDIRPHNITDCFDSIYKHIANQGNSIIRGLDSRINGANMSRIGQDLYFGTDTYDQDNTNFLTLVTREFSNTRNHIVNTGGHSDSTYCPVCPGLIISLSDMHIYADTFPNWEVVYLPGQSWGMVKDFLQLKKKNGGRWWIPGFENDQDVVNTVEQWLSHWTGYVEETVFDVNMLIIDPKNVMVFNYNKQVFDALDRYGITAHIVPFRHRYFWDGGIHCITSDLHREGIMQDYFPGRL
jgi:hypothetical protein